MWGVGVGVGLGGIVRTDSKRGLPTVMSLWAAETRASVAQHSGSPRNRTGSAVSRLVPISSSYLYMCAHAHPGQPSMTQNGVAGRRDTARAKPTWLEGGKGRGGENVQVHRWCGRTALWCH